MKNQQNTMKKHTLSFGTFPVGCVIRDKRQKDSLPHFLHICTADENGVIVQTDTISAPIRISYDDLVKTSQYAYFCFGDSVSKLQWEDFSSNFSLDNQNQQLEKLSKEISLLKNEEIKAQRLINAGDKLMEIVEGVRNERWASNGRRLVDTKEWCEFYCAWAALKKEFITE